MMELRLPWPDRHLSPNSRHDLRSVTAYRRAAREIAFVEVQESGSSFERTELSMILRLCPPDRRRRDMDNVYAAFKAYQDGIFTALHLDDSLLRRVTLQWGDVEDKGAVYVRIERLTPPLGSVLTAEDFIGTIERGLKQ